MPLVIRTVSSRHCNLSVADNQQRGLPLLMLHGTATSKSVFAQQFSSHVLRDFRLLALDFPGHGQSEDAHSAETAYTLEGLAQATIDVLDALEIDHVALLGWSLGGHVAVELMRMIPERLRGVILTGAPPAGRGILGLLRAFRLRPELSFSSKPEFSDSEVRRFAKLCFGDAATPELMADIVRSDGRSRAVIYRSLRSIAGKSQRAVVEASHLPIAMINGANDPVARLHYLDSLKIQNRWGGGNHVIEGAAHAPFLQRPEIYNLLTARFLSALAGNETAQIVQEPVRASA